MRTISATDAGPVGENEWTVDDIIPLDSAISRMGTFEYPEDRLRASVDRLTDAVERLTEALDRHQVSASAGAASSGPSR